MDTTISMKNMKNMEDMEDMEGMEDIKVIDDLLKCMKSNENYKNIIIKCIQNNLPHTGLLLCYVLNDENTNTFVPILNKLIECKN